MCVCLCSNSITLFKNVTKYETFKILLYFDFYNSSSFDFLHNADKLSKIYKMDKKRHKKISPKHIKRNQTETKSTKLTLKQRRLQQS